VLDVEVALEQVLAEVLAGVRLAAALVVVSAVPLVLSQGKPLLHIPLRWSCNNTAFSHPTTEVSSWSLLGYNQRARMW